MLAALRERLVPLVAAIAGRAAAGRMIALLARHYPREAQRLRRAGGGADRLRIRARPARRDGPSVLHRPRSARLPDHDPLRRAAFSRRVFRHFARGGARHLRPGLCRPSISGLPPGDAVSLGIHESQSRMWENLVGRSRAFWELFLSAGARRHFPSRWRASRSTTSIFAINDVRPSLIRVEADEATYNLHILIRFELEVRSAGRRLASGRSAGRLEREISALSRHHAAHRCRRRVAGHSLERGPGRLFPDLFAGQSLRLAVLSPRPTAIWGACTRQFARGEFGPLREWLREQIHQYGCRYTAPELVERVTGAPLSHEPLMKHLYGKFGPLFGLADASPKR